jgi:hypothetical protein
MEVSGVWKQRLTTSCVTEMRYINDWPVEAVVEKCIF